MYHPKAPSFSSTLLDQIYHSIDQGERSVGKCEQKQDSPTDRWMDRRSNTRWLSHHRIHDQDQDALFFSSTSTSSDSSSGGLSSSDTEPVYGARSRASCFAPLRPKPVRTGASACEKSVSESERRRRGALFKQQMFDRYSREQEASNEEGLIKSKSRALKIYNNLKKVKQPISPGGKLTNFLNSLFTTGNTKKTKTNSCVGSYQDLNAERKAKSGQASTCSSAASLSRSCLRNTSPSSTEKLRNGVKRRVRFYPISVILDEDSRPCGHKCLYEEAAASRGELLKEYRRRQKKSDLDLVLGINDEDEDDDDAASYSSSDLFELDLIGNDRYFEELPVYETTHLPTNRAIANGLII